MRFHFLLFVLLASVANAQQVIFDTDIGTDIDDAYALVALMKERCARYPFAARYPGGSGAHTAR